MADCQGQRAQRRFWVSGLYKVLGRKRTEIRVHTEFTAAHCSGRLRVQEASNEFLLGVVAGLRVFASLCSDLEFKDETLGVAWAWDSRLSDAGCEGR